MNTTKAVTGEHLPAELDRILAKYETYQGDNESESIVTSNTADEQDGFVNVWAGRGKDIRGIIKRCRTAIISARDTQYGVDFCVDVSAFRGVAYSFKVLH